MPVQIKPIDITTFKGDAIVNSLGIYERIHVYGKLCQSIMNAAKSERLIETIASQENDAHPGYVFVTKGEKLPAKYIIHAVTPYFSHDPLFYELECTYIRILDKARRYKFYKIALPIIGATNGYPNVITRKMVITLVDAYVKLHPEMRVTISIPVKDAEEYTNITDQKWIDEQIEKFYIEHPEIEKRDFVYDKEYFESEFQNQENMFNYSSEKVENEEPFRPVIIYVDGNPVRLLKRKTTEEFEEDYTAIVESGKRPALFDFTSLKKYSINDYVERYVDERYNLQQDRNRILTNIRKLVASIDGAGSLKSKHSNPKTRDGADLSMLMRYILALHMNIEEANEFLRFCGKAFSPIDPNHNFYVSLIKNESYTKSFDDNKYINNRCKSKKVISIFPKTNDYSD